MDAQGYLLAANAVVWIGLGAYAAFLWAGSLRLSRRLDQLEALTRDEEAGS